MLKRTLSGITAEDESSIHGKRTHRPQRSASFRRSSMPALNRLTNVNQIIILQFRRKRKEKEKPKPIDFPGKFSRIVENSQTETELETS